MSDQAEFAALCPELFRPGRFYLTASGLLPMCGRLPIAMPRGGLLYEALGPRRPWLTINLLRFLGKRPCRLGPACRPNCPLSERIASIPREAGMVYRAGLAWIPQRQYPLPKGWEFLVNRYGIRWPLAGLPSQDPPRPKMPVLVAHTRGIIGMSLLGGARPAITPAIVYAFRIQTIEYIPDPADDGRRLKSALARALALKVPLDIAVPDPACRQAGREGARMR